jgi:molybdenum cofactor cytidylyltransferase
VPPVVGVVVLAAGASRRLPGPKQLLRYRGETLLRRAARIAVEAACGPVVVVLGAAADRLRPELDGLDLRVVENRRAARGLSDSIRTGLEALVAKAEPDAALFLPCDQPGISTDLLREMVGAFAASGPPAVASAYAGTVGVPALFSRTLFAELRALHGDAGAKRVLQRHAGEIVKIPFEPGALDIDTPADAAGLT